MYLQQRSRWKDRHPLKWDSSAAGHVAAEESYEETARRELEEELGINVPLEKLLKLPASARTEQEFVWLYRGEIRGSPMVNRSEIETGAFFLRLLSMVGSRHDRRISHPDLSNAGRPIGEKRAPTAITLLEPDKSPLR